MKKTFLILLLVIGILLTGCEKEEVNHEKVLIDIENYGQIEVELYREYAPVTVDNFLELVENKFYDGLTFHRIIKDFMIQGGAPKENSGEVKTIFGEFSNNGYRKNTLKHVRGTISMARTPFDNNSASSQFFIVHKDSPHLDGDYAAFGKVTKGIEVVDKICDEVKVEDDNGTVLEENQPVIKSITIVE